MKLTLRTLLLGALLTTTGSLSQAAVVMKVDISDYNDIRFWAAREYASANVTGYDAANGISLIGILTQNHNSGDAQNSSALEAAGMFAPYSNIYAVDFFAQQYVGKDINLYSGTVGQNNDFSTNAAAFTGVASFRLLTNQYYFQTNGYIGDIYVGDGTVQSGPKIGSYMVVKPVITANGDTPSPNPARGPWNAGSLIVGNTASGDLTIAGGGSVYSAETSV